MQSVTQSQRLIFVVAVAVFFSGFVELKLTLQFIWKCERLRIAKSVMKNRIGVLPLADTKTYYKTISIKAEFHMLWFLDWQPQLHLGAC